MSEEDEISVPLPILEPKKRGRKKKSKTDESLGAPPNEVEMFMDNIISSVSRMTLAYENEIKGLKILLAAAALKFGGKMSVNKDMMDLAGERYNDLKLVEENDMTKISL